MVSFQETKIRIVTAASLFDGHDAAINIMRRILQQKGVEIIHLGHNRSAREIVEAAIEEDAHAIAVTSYQGGHIEFFRYMKDLLEDSGCGHIRIFGGGGGTILPAEIEQLHAYGIARIYSPDDGRKMGLEGMIDEVVRLSLPEDPKQKKALVRGHDFWRAAEKWNDAPPLGEYIDIRKVARAITVAEEGRPPDGFQSSIGFSDCSKEIPVIGITGTGGAGKSSVTDEIARRFLRYFPEKTMAVISVDPSKKKTGGALLGDRIRMNAMAGPRSYMRSMATREDNASVSMSVRAAIQVCRKAGYDCILVETAGVGQSDTSVIDLCDVSIYVMTPEYGAASQLEKINMLDYADLICINKSDKPGARDALLEVRKQYKRNHGLWTAKDEELPVFAVVANQFNNEGVNEFFHQLLFTIEKKTGVSWAACPRDEAGVKSPPVLPSNRVRYLSEIAASGREYDQLVREQSAIASELYRLQGAVDSLERESNAETANAIGLLRDRMARLQEQLTPVSRKLIQNWPNKVQAYAKDHYTYQVRQHEVRQPLFSTSLSGLRIPKIVMPSFKDWGDILTWQAQENVPGHFPFTAGVFPLKRTGEDPTRMFAGEGGPERTNFRFHYVSAGQEAKRLSTAFDSVTLYGEDPDRRPDIYGKIGNSGVSIATVDDIKKLYSGFDLCDPKTSVSMTINGPAPVLLAFFMHAAIDQLCEKYITENGLWEKVNALRSDWYGTHSKPSYLNPLATGLLPEGHNGLGLGLLGLSGEDVLPPDVYARLKASALAQVRGTVQADILKEDQAQNTCIFSTEFALKLMGDVQEYFIKHEVRNFYSVSISGYHIAEAGANPITQLSFTLANGFTYVEYYLSRGMPVDSFAPNLSFFFSNGMDVEYSVIGRVARRIWAKAMKYYYKANKRSQMLKYHIQTSGRSLHAQEIDFNDIRTTLQALYAIYDNCNSLHTNAYDEAITTPTEESVRRAMAIQLIINKELGTATTENFIQGSFVVEELTRLVEEAVWAEFDRITERGGVLASMERMYQRNKIQEESLHYESRKHSGALPVIGVNTFLNSKGSPTVLPGEVIRSNEAEKDRQILSVEAFRERNRDRSVIALRQLRQAALQQKNLFGQLMDCVKYCSLGQITYALYEVGGQYRRNM